MIALTGATGLAGQALLPLADLTLGRRATSLPHRPWDLADGAPDLSGVTTLIHAAFSHVRGRYRGGEGDDPEGFLLANLDGTKRLFDAAAEAGVQKILFLSSRAVYDGYPAGTDLREDLPPRPQSLYGKVKTEAEKHLSTLPLIGISIRSTGLYGPGIPDARRHKWRRLFDDYFDGRPIEPKRATEVHFDDLRSAVQFLMHDTTSGPAHLSDLLLDRHDLLREVQNRTACAYALPERATNEVSVLRCDRLQALGWEAGGMALLRASLPAML
jgi:nucleoside-diphosphate-sugar epimerase